jgi:hypothetical protein
MLGGGVAVPDIDRARKLTFGAEGSRCSGHGVIHGCEGRGRDENERVPRDGTARERMLDFLSPYKLLIEAWEWLW